MEDSQIKIKPHFNNGTIKRIKARVAEEHPGWIDQQIHDHIGARWHTDHDTCIPAGYETAREILKETMTKIIAFFVGEGQPTAQSFGMYQTIWKDKIKYADHPFLKPWYSAAYPHVNRRTVYDLDRATYQGDIEQFPRVKVRFDCGGGCHKPNCTSYSSFEVRFGLATKMAVGGITRAEWAQHISNNPKLQVSHLNSIAGDCNPLNFTMETQAICLSRKLCHTIDVVMAHPDEHFCRRHEEPKCHQQSLRMQKNWPLIIAKMIELGKHGQPAIDAYESGIDFMM